MQSNGFNIESVFEKCNKHSGMILLIPRQKELMGKKSKWIVCFKRRDNKRIVVSPQGSPEKKYQP